MLPHARCPDQPLTVSELQKRLHTLGADVTKRRLMHWIENELVPVEKREKRHGLGRGKGFTASVFLEDTAEWMAAGVWALRSEEKGEKTPLASTIKKVQLAASEIYKYPTVLLSLPDNVKNGEDPPFNKVTFSIECSPDIERFLFPYVIATEKAKHNWHITRPAVVSFKWAESAKARKDSRGTVAQNLPSTRELIGVQVGCSPRRKNELRFLVDEKDVREHFLERRKVDRKLRSKYPEYKARAGGVPKGCVWPLAVNPIQIGDETFLEALSRYKKGQVSDRERRSRLIWANHLETLRDAERDMQDRKSRN